MSRLTLAALLLLPVIACDGGSTDPKDDVDDTDDTTDTTDDTDTQTESLCGDDGVGILSGTYTEDLTLDPDCNWLLSGGVIIGDDVNPTVLTIEAGTTIYGESATDGFLVIRRGSRIEAVGTASEPIVFTSDQPEGSRGRGNWGGLVINGRAPINACEPPTADCEAQGEGGTGLYGGSDPDDNSGTLRYVRVEYGGTEISADNELNAITLSGVGRATQIDHIQVHANLDDGIEFFGGTAQVKYLVASCTGDDLIDFDLGWQGKVQHAVAIQCDDAGNNGFEADNNEAKNDADPTTNPVFSNVTLIGSTAIAEDNFAMVLRRGVAGQYWNLYATGFSLGCLAVRDDVTYANATGGDLALEHVWFDCDAPFEVDDAADADQEEDVFGDGTGNMADANADLAPTYSDDPDFSVPAGSPAAGAGATPADAWFDDAPYIGAFEPGGDDWTDGWTNFSRD
jgi:hypothetical protein